MEEVQHLHLQPLVEGLVLNRRESRNRDYIKGVDYPLQTYGFTGIQWGDSADSETAGKRPTDAAPMSIGSQPPGSFANDDNEWKLTFGASHDAVLTLFNGKFFNNFSLFEIPKNLGGIYRDAIGTGDENTLEQVNGIQQIQYIVSKESASEAREALDFGDDVDAARSIGFRIPAMAAGWGRTIGMRPTDPDPTEDANKRRNDEEHKLSRETWPHGPIDVRWDARRGVWAAWHDLIADHNGQNLGSLVFDTNPDPSCGFPFLKGKLEDVWKIIISDPDFGTGVDSDTEKSGDVATHLGHFWTEFSDEAWQFAPLSSTFKIHRADTSTGQCGDEVFQLAPQIEILTSTFFHDSDEFDGPICFDTSPPDDNDLVGCMKFDGVQWVPAVPFDFCEQGGFELGVLFNNDKILAEKIIEVCKLLLECLGKANPKGDPDNLRDAGGAAGDASSAASDAEAAIDGLNGGMDFMAGDSLSPGDPPMTAEQAATFNDLTAEASSAYDNSQTQHSEAQAALDAAATAQENANSASQNLAEATATADQTQAAADAANAALAEAPNDGSTREAARNANEANAEAQAARNQATQEFNQANEAADSARQAAETETAEAIEAGNEAQTAGDALEQAANDAGQTLPDDVQNAMDVADAEASAFEEAADNAGLKDEEEQTQEQLKQELCDKIDQAQNDTLIAVAQGARLKAQGVGEQIQQAVNDMADYVNISMQNLIDAIHSSPLGNFAQFDQETGTGGVTAPTAQTPPVVAPTSCTTMPQTPTTPTTPDNGGPTSERPKDGSGGGSEAPPPGEPGGGGGTTAPPTTPKVPPPAPPTCPIIKITDPCNPFNKPVFGPCPGGEGSGEARGEPGADRGPGDPNQNPDGGVDPNNGQVFPPGDGQPFGLGGERPLLPPGFGPPPG